MYINESFFYFHLIYHHKKERIPAIFKKKREEMHWKMLFVCYYFTYQTGYTCLFVCVFLWIHLICYYKYEDEYTKIECVEKKTMFKIGFLESLPNVFESNQRQKEVYSVLLCSSTSMYGIGFKA